MERITDRFDKMIIFFGTSRVGKTHIILNTAKLLAKAGKNILLIDTTVDQGVYNYFNYNNDIEEQMGLSKLTPIIRHNIDILTDNPLKHKGEIDYSSFENFDISEYDFVLVEADETINKNWFGKCFKRFLVQNFDMDRLIRNLDFVAELMKEKDGHQEVNIIYNQMIECKLKKNYILERFIKIHKTIFYNCIDIEILFEEANIIEALNNKVDGRIQLKGYTSDYKQSIFEIAEVINPMGKKIFKKIIS